MICNKFYVHFCRLLIVKHVVTKYKSTSCNHNLKSLLLEMPKLPKHTAALKLQRQKNKEKSQKYVPGIVTLQVLGSGANGAPRSLYVFTDQSRYMFNCGEGTQRLAHEHKMKLAKLEHIFFTHGSWENIGGLPGISLTIQDVGVPEITVHGPNGIVDIFSATRRFIVLKDLAVKAADNVETFEDNVMKVNYVPLRAEIPHESRKTSVSLDRTTGRRESASGGESSGTEGMTSEDETDYYAYERSSVLLYEENASKKKKKKRKSKRSSSESNNEENVAKRRRVDAVSNVAMSYICKLHNKPGALNLEACAEKGIRPGPIFGRLKAGEDVVLEDGTVIKSSEVTFADDPGPVFIVIEIPNEKFLDALEKEEKFRSFQSGATNPDEIAYLVVHFSPPNIVDNPRYRKWMDKFPQTTQHLMINEGNTCMGSIAVHRIQYKLNMLQPEIFPLLSDKDIPEISNSPFPNGTKENDKNDNNSSQDHSTNCSSCSTSKDHLIYQGKTFSIVQLRPQKQLDSFNELSLNLEQYKKEVFQEDQMEQTLDELHAALEDPKYNVADQEYPSVLFLGTGSCIPNKTRNTSGILLSISDSNHILMDCGEGTYGQLVRFYGNENIGKIMSSLRAIYVSHLHADHHIGLIGLLKARRKYTVGNDGVQPFYLLAPKQIMTWLKYYNDHFESILEQVELVPNGDLVYNNVTVSRNAMNRLLNCLGMESILTCPVNHCPNSFGVAVKHKSGWKITYSGDTMPCDALVELGKDSTILIHEATMEDELKHEARIKMHSTTSEAIEIGKRMSAQFTLLTHFSQRYATLPRFNDNIKDGVGIAFDNMKVRLTDLNRLPLMYPALKMMFSSHQEELEQKAYRRQLKQLQMAGSRSPSASRSSSPSK